MSNYRKLHTEWDCKFHVVFILKYRRRVLYGTIREHSGEIFRRLARQKECEIEEGHLVADHVHMMIAIPPNSNQNGQNLLRLQLMGTFYLTAWVGVSFLRRL